MPDNKKPTPPQNVQFLIDLKYDQDGNVMVSMSVGSLVQTNILVPAGYFEKFVEEWKGREIEKTPKKIH